VAFGAVLLHGQLQLVVVDAVSVLGVLVEEPEEVPVVVLAAVASAREIVSSIYGRFSTRACKSTSLKGSPLSSFFVKNGRFY
jgi:hypothetical protein